jgi:hypothetical protein
MNRFFKTIVASMGIAFAIPMAAYADDNKPDYSVRALNVANAPVTLKNARSEWVCGWAAERLCMGPTAPGSQMAFYARIDNGITSRLLSMGVELKIYDADGAMIGKADVSPIFNAPILHGEPQIVKISAGGFFENSVPFNLTEPPSAVSYVSMRITKASFTGGKTWVLGKGFTSR